ncbi:ETX/MTX2 family pore-forming toxin [Streptomyces sp. NBC_00341]|uniref:ETX/MTX2 family pore-forming toxin n=1 Tax=Streptomyces sp. NBC_00341 TaxID=2975717 RepID=UPI003085A183|nr:ETX/MTX2 family pore-forming toxin [Streptomyces sp. NBC_00341]
MKEVGMVVQYTDIEGIIRGLPDTKLGKVTKPTITPAEEIVYSKDDFKADESWDDVYTQVYDNRTKVSPLVMTFKHTEETHHSVSTTVSQTVLLGAELSIEGSCGGPPPIPGYKLGAKFKVDVSKTTSKQEVWSEKKGWEVDQQVTVPPNKKYQAVMKIMVTHQKTTWSGKCQLSGPFGTVTQGDEVVVSYDLTWGAAVLKAAYEGGSRDWSGWDMESGGQDDVYAVISGEVAAQFGVKVLVEVTDITYPEKPHTIDIYAGSPKNA